MIRIVLALAALLFLGALGAGGYYVVRRNADPTLRAERLIAQGDYRSAQVELRNALRAKPDSADAHLRMARLQMKLADPVAAEREFRAAANLGADRWDVLPQLGEAMVVQGRFRDVLAQIPPRGDTPANAAKNLLLRSVAQLSLGDIPATEATLAEAERLAPDSPETALIAARLAATRNDAPTMETKIEDVLRRDPNQVEALLLKTKLQIARNDRAAAAETANKAVSAAPWSAMARIDRANQFIFAGKDALAQADVDAVLETQPRFIDAVYLNGILLARRGKYTEAAAELLKLDGVGARLPQILYYQSLVASNLNQIETARDYARRYNTLSPADPDGVLQLARTELAANRPAEAAAVLRKAVADGQNDSRTLDLLGRAQAAAGNRPAATEAFNQATKLAPEDAAIRANLGLSQLQEGNAAGALSTLEQSYQADPKLQGAGEAVVAAALGTGDIDKAQAALDSLRARIGETEGVGILAGMIRFARNDLDGARTALANTLRAFPNSASAKFNLARVSIRQGRRPEALTMLRDILAKDPANNPVLTTYLFALAEENQLPAAIQALEAARRVEPQNPVLASKLADTLVAIGSPERAVALLDTMRRGNEPFPPSLLAPLGRAQAAAGATADAKATYREALAATPADLLVRGLLVDLLARDKDFAGIAKTLQEALAANPGNYRVMWAMVENELAWHDLDAALRLADQLRRQPGSTPGSTFLKGDLLRQARRPAESAQAYLAEQAGNPSPILQMRAVAALAAAGQDDQATRILRTWLNDRQPPPEAAQALAQLDIKARRFDDARNNLLRVLESRPDDALALNNLAWTYQMLGDPRARETAQRAYLRAPTPEAADTLAWIMVGEGASKAAIPLLQRANQQRPTDPGIRYHLATALKNEGQTEEAATLLRTLLAAPAPFPDRDAARTLLDQLSRRE